MAIPTFIPFAGVYELPFMMPFVELANMWMNFCFAPFMTASNTNFPLHQPPFNPTQNEQANTTTPRANPEIDKNYVMSLVTSLVNEKLNTIEAKSSPADFNRLILLESDMNALRNQFTEFKNSQQGAKADSAVKQSHMESQLADLSASVVRLSKQQSAINIEPKPNQAWDKRLLTAENSLQEMSMAQQKLENQNQTQLRKIEAFDQRFETQETTLGELKRSQEALKNAPIPSNPAIESALQEIRNTQEKLESQDQIQLQKIGDINKKFDSQETTLGELKRSQEALKNAPIPSNPAIESALQEIRNTQEKLQSLHKTQFKDIENISARLAAQADELAELHRAQKTTSRDHAEASPAVEAALQEIRNTQQHLAVQSQTHFKNIDAISERIEIQSSAFTDIQHLLNTLKTTTDQNQLSLETALTDLRYTQQRQELQEQSQTAEMEAFKDRIEDQSLAFEDLKRLMDTLKVTADQGREFIENAMKELRETKPKETAQDKNLSQTIEELRNNQLKYEAHNQAQAQDIRTVKTRFDLQDIALNDMQQALTVIKENTGKGDSSITDKIIQIEGALTERLNKLDAAVSTALTQRAPDPSISIQMQKEWDQKLDKVRSSWEQSLATYKETISKLIQTEMTKTTDSLKKAATGTTQPHTGSTDGQTNELINTVQEAFVVFFRKNMLKMSDFSPHLQDILTARISAACLSPLMTEEQKQASLNQGA